jgi:hypothetical protein
LISSLQKLTQAAAEPLLRSLPPIRTHFHQILERILVQVIRMQALLGNQGTEKERANRTLSLTLAKTLKVDFSVIKLIAQKLSLVLSTMQIV